MLKTGPLPRYYQLKEIIREKIRSGEWAEGELIPSERELCEQYGISRMTARQAITELVKEGFLYREQGKGTFVSRPKIIQQLTKLTSFTQDMQARAWIPGTQVLEANMWLADEAAAKKLRIKPSQPVFRLHRLRLANAEPLALETTCINFMGCEKLLEENFENQSLYVVLTEKYGLTMLEADQEMEAGLATEDEASLLQVPPGAPVLHTHRITYNERNQAIEYAQSVYRGDKYKFYTKLIKE
jgi:GntR family transcriptional regulator